MPVTVPDYEGTTPIAEILASCGGIKIMTSIDLRNSFWQMPLSRDSRCYTGFLYKGKSYQFTVTPFGLKTRGLDSILTEEVKAFTLIYVDDCLVISRSINEHLQHLKLLLENFRETNITVNFSNSQLFRKQTNYLGYVWTTDGISTDSTKIETILRYPRLRNHRQLKAFRGLTGLYQRFASKYAAATQPLLQLLKKDKQFKWTPELERHLF